MGAPTWPPTPEDAHKATLEEYGDQARAVLEAETDEEAERALLARFLFEPPRRELATGDECGTTLDTLSRSLSAWLRMVSGQDFELAESDPPSTDGFGLFLPRAVPAPVQPAEDALLYRVMGLVQLGFVRWGLLSNRPFLAEIHRDWVLRSTFHLLALRHVAHRWSAEWPGIARDFEGIRFLDKAGIMRVNVMVVPRKGMPGPFLPLYDGLVDFLEEAGPEADFARRAVARVDELDPTGDPRAALPVLIGQAWALRLEYKRLRLGPPPLPWFAGIIRPEWLLHDVAALLREQNRWKEGPTPLRLLKRVMRKKGESSVPSKVRRLMCAGRDSTLPPPPHEVIKSQVEAPPAQDDEAREYDEWDDERGVYKVALTRVVEEEAPPGPLENYEKAVRANQAQIKEVRRKFEALRIDERWLHGQRDGTELDLNRAVAAMADIRAGFTPKVDWYMHYVRQRQSVAILTLVDLSGSTQGNIIYREQEALILLAEGLKALRFPHAFYGFSNQGPRNCRFQRIRGWDEPYGEAVYKRLGNLRPGGATRLGAFIRHASWMLGQRPEARRILMIVSDGRPHCRGEYRERYGVRDSAMAVQESRRDGVYTYCVSLDTHESAEEYLREIFGPRRYLVLDRVDDLPIRLPEVFRGLVK